MRLSIPTIYRRRLFRSKLEADWARAFDSLGIPWEYERAGRYWGNTFYLPDFYLPRSRQYVEVKGAWTPDDTRKVYAMLRGVAGRPYTGADTPDLSLVAANPGGAFWGLLRPEGDFEDFLLNSHRATLLQCGACGGRWFAVEWGGWGCQCCGSAAPPADQILSPITPWPVCLREAA